MAKAKNPTKYTPPGIAAYPYLNRPDTKAFNGEEAKPKYKVRFRFDPSDPKWAAFKTETLEWMAERQAEYGKENPKYAKQLTVKYEAFREVFNDEGDPTGEEEMVVTMNASYRDKATGKVIQMKPGIVDAKNKKLGNPPDIYGGSTLRLAVRPGVMGTGKEITQSWQLVGVQIIDLAEKAGGFEFGETEGGYEADEDEQKAPEFPDGATDSADSGDDTSKPEDF
jgi:hypothetical protein